MLKGTGKLNLIKEIGFTVRAFIDGSDICIDTNITNETRDGSGRSLMNIRKSVGPRIEPWGTPAEIFHQILYQLCFEFSAFFLPKLTFKNDNDLLSFSINSVLF